MEKGDILRGRPGSDAIHPIVYLSSHDQDFFIGAMLTHANDYPDNISMKAEYFQLLDASGTKYEFYFNDTYLVKAKLIKKVEWQPFRKVGALTKAGIEFIESKVGDDNEKFWEEYIAPPKGSL